jgi:hypothetical protein
VFFFEKKNQKTFATCGRSRFQAAEPDSEGQLQKFFGSFFQKRTTSFLAFFGVHENVTWAAEAASTYSLLGQKRPPKRGRF